MKSIILFLIFSIQMSAQSNTYELLYEHYSQFKEESIKDRRFKHTEIMEILHKHESNPLFDIKKMGESIEGRDIKLVSIGHGPTPVFLWSQMHGDEPTATMALMDIFNFLEDEKSFPKLKKLLLDSLTLHFIPMLNPDGAERYTRRNALHVDLNRDALRQQNPEAIILKDVRDSLDAKWGFNLHDQNPYYGAGITDKTASVSFLAPAYNYAKDNNEVRGNAMKLIVVMNNILQKYIPQKTGRYSDDFEPRAFGDNIQKWGTSTILIEAGGLAGDKEKQYLRKLHFVIMLASFEAIANGEVDKANMDGYNTIPFNESNQFHDLLIRNANITKDGKSYIVDIAMRDHEVQYDNNRKFYTSSWIKDIGDLHTVHGYREFDAATYQVEPARAYEKKICKIKKIKKLNLLSMLKKGITDFRMKKLPPAMETYDLPVRLFSGDTNPNNSVGLGHNPSLLFKKDGEVKMVLINGHIYDLEKDAATINATFNSKK